MERSYWIHRISHLAEISYPLLDNNYLSYGFSDFENDSFIEGVRGENGWQFMEQQFMLEWGELPRTRFQLWNFIHEMKAGDWVIVPTYGEFSICEFLEDEPIMIKDIKDITIKNWSGEEILRDKDGYLVNSDNARIDLGFARRIRMIQKGISRYDYADSGYLTGQWLFVGGQVGCGKTHICTAAVNKLLEKNIGCRYMAWRDESVQLKAIVNEQQEYHERLMELCKAPILYIDDFFKTQKGQRPTQADVNLAFQIINYRYQDRTKATIISSELSTMEIMSIDEAVGSRIHERSKA